MWSVVIIAILGLCALQTGASSPHPVPRSEPLTLPIHTLQARGIGDKGNADAGLSSVSMSSDRQSYFTIIKTGSINFRVALDTASSDLWIVSSLCGTTECKTVPRYPLTYQSPTFVAVSDNKTTFNVSYADGTVASGFVAREAVSLANFTIPEQTFGLVTESNITFMDQTSGILGLGFPRLSSISHTTNSTPFFPTLAQKGLLEYPLFAFSLRRNSTGSLSIGAIDASVVTNASNIAWNKVASFPPFVTENNVTTASYLQWAIPLAAFSVNGTSLSPIPTYPSVAGGRSLALIDVGASGIFGPIQDVSRIFSAIEGSRLVESASGQWAIPCDTVVPISFTFGSRSYTLLPEDYIIGPASGNPNLCLSWPRALPPNSDGIDWQMGAAFLRTVYSIYNYGINTKEPPMIGLYPLRNETALANQTQTQQSMASFFSSASATVATTLPNFILPTPTYTTPPYTLNSSIPVSIGAVVSSQLATSTYSAVFGTYTTFNASAIPTIAPQPTISTIVLTDALGQLQTTVSTYTIAAVTLGIPPGWNAAYSVRSAFWVTHFAWPTLLLTSMLICLTNLIL